MIILAGLVVGAASVHAIVVAMLFHNIHLHFGDARTPVVRVGEIAEC